jgi:hypothetical protein
MHLMPISPNHGATSGGTTVTITGTNLAGATAVHFGQKSATITANTPTSVTVICPAGSGVVETSVTTPGGISNPLEFYYVSPPFVASIGSSSGPTAGGNTVTLSGVNLSTATAVNFGANSATPTVVNDGLISVTVPAGADAGSVSVTVTTAGGTDGPPDSYRYVDAPTIGTVSPASGPTAGGTVVSVTGTGLSTAAAVTFGGTSASFTVISDSVVSVSAPPGAAAGTVDVTVTSAVGSATAVDAFTYVAGPGI